MGKPHGVHESSCLTLLESGFSICKHTKFFVEVEGLLLDDQSPFPSGST